MYNIQSISSFLICLFEYSHPKDIIDSNSIMKRCKTLKWWAPYICSVCILCKTTLLAGNSNDKCLHRVEMKFLRPVLKCIHMHNDALSDNSLNLCVLSRVLRRLCLNCISLCTKSWNCLCLFFSKSFCRVFFVVCQS